MRETEVRGRIWVVYIQKAAHQEGNMTLEKTVSRSKLIRKTNILY